MADAVADDALVPDDVAERLAGLAIGDAELGGSDLDIVAQVIGRLIQQNLPPSRANVLRVAEAFVRLPQPPDEPADALERRRLVNDLLGQPSPEDTLNARLRARQALQNHSATMPAE